MTITRTGKPGRIVSVGWMLRLRRTTCWPVWFRLSAAAAPERRHDGAVVVGSAELRADAEQGRERGRPEQPAPMVVDLVLEAGKALRVGAGLALQHDRAAVRHDQPRPDQEHAILSERNLAVVGADQLRALRDEEILAGRAVIDVLGHLGGDLARQIGTNAGDERRRNDSARLHDVPRCRVGQADRG